VILQQLREDSERIVRETTGEDLPPPMYNRKPVRWVISLDEAGGFQGFVKTEDEKKRGRLRTVPDVKVAGIVIRPKLLADTPAYTLGVTDDHRASLKFGEYKRLIELCAEETQNQEVRAVSKFLNAYDSEMIPPPEDMVPADVITFRVGDIYPTEAKEVKEYWALNARESKGRETEGSQCLICGNPKAEIVDRHPDRIKGLVGGQPGGTDLVSVNSTAFESFGLKAAFSSPACRECGERYAKALNALIRGESTHITLGPAVFVFWAAEGGDTSWMTATQNPDPETVKKLLASFYNGVKRAPVETADFYATSLTANSARAVIRDWLHTTVGAAQDQLAEWFARLEMTDAYGQEGSPLGIYRLSASLYRDARKEMPAQTPRLLMGAALHGEVLPDSLLVQAVKRNRAEQDVTYPRASLMKAILLSSTSDAQEMQRMSQLDPNHPEPAYHCGRLLAELEGLQRAALGRINATLVDRFYGTASAAPATVFGTLLKGAQPHLSYLRKNRPGAHNAIQERLEEILGAIGEEFPSTLTLRKQAYFGLGYYHQRARNRRNAAERSQPGDTSVSEELSETSEENE
jgi:CRISPR-associated protein Csd1